MIIMIHTKTPRNRLTKQVLFPQGTISQLPQHCQREHTNKTFVNYIQDIHLVSLSLTRAFISCLRSREMGNMFFSMQINAIRMKGILESEGRLGFFMDDSSRRRNISRGEKE
jgi:hypothetical protein